jgi:putative addiction module component (TIGR02574 family)
MAETLERLKVQLEHLSTEDKTELAHFLLGSLELEEEGVAAAWDLEIARRVDEIRSGHATGTPAEEVFAELERRPE